MGRRKSQSPDETLTASPLAPLSGAQHSLLLRLARGPGACGGVDTIPVKYLLERGFAFPSPDGHALYEITPAGRRFIAMLNARE
jgi:hypothetical protein